MKLMLYEMSLFMQRDMEEVLRRLGIDFRVFMYPFEPAMAAEDSFFEKHFGEALRAGDYDGVLSLNFWSPIARTCHEIGIPYIAWVYDCPFGLSQPEEVLQLPTNRIFVFDRFTCNKLWERGIETVIHMPLGANLERLDRICLSDEEEKRYGVDVSFVGTLYPSSFGGFSARLGEYERGYIDGVIAAQSKVYGAYLLEDDLSGVSGRIQEILEPESTGEYERWIFHESLQSLVAKEITRRDRLTILAALSESYRVALYSNREEPLLKKAEFRGTVDSYDEIFRVYKASRINLNITFRRIVSGIPLRVMDILGAGGFLLTNYQEEICEHFRPGVDLAVYESIEDALMQAMYYLEHEDERREIAGNGRRAMERFEMGRLVQEMIGAVFGAEENG